MKRLLLAIVGMLIIVPVLASGCAAKAPATLTPAEEVTGRSCATCHTDKNLLKEVATEPEKTVSEETSGEG